MARSNIQQSQSKKKTTRSGAQRTQVGKDVEKEAQSVPLLWRARIKKASKRVLHDYVIPYTRMLERRLLRLEHSL